MTLPFPYFLFSGTNGFFLHATNVYLIDDVISTSSSKTNSLGFSRHSSLVWQTMMNRDGDAGIFFLPIFFPGRRNIYRGSDANFLFFPGRTVFFPRIDNWTSDRWLDVSSLFSGTNGFFLNKTDRMIIFGRDLDASFPFFPGRTVFFPLE